MKEISIEDKAKRYDEAVKKLKVLYDDWATTQNRAAKEVEEIFPELKDEDERIIKALIKYFTLSDDNADYQCCGVHCKDIIAWLEKQSEYTKFRE